MVFYHCLLFFLHIQLFIELNILCSLLRKPAYSVSVLLPPQASHSRTWGHLVLSPDLVREKNWNTGFPCYPFPVPFSGLWECMLVKAWTKSKREMPWNQWTLAGGPLGSSGLCFVSAAIPSWEDTLTSSQSPKVRLACGEEEEEFRRESS